MDHASSDEERRLIEVADQAAPRGDTITPTEAA
jgi:hypothetical protein